MDVNDGVIVVADDFGNVDDGDIADVDNVDDGDIGDVGIVCVG